MDRLLHRGKYARDVDGRSLAVEDAVPVKKKITWLSLLGAEGDYPLKDRWIAGLITGWLLLLAGIMIIGSVWNLNQSVAGCGVVKVLAHFWNFSTAHDQCRNGRLVYLWGDWGSQGLFPNPRLRAG